MAHETATLFFALLAAALTLVVTAVGVSLVFDRDDRLGFLGQLRPVASEAAAAVAVTCTLGSLYLSEVAGFVPCRLCWVQRAFMYPAAAVLIAAVVTRRRSLAYAGGALAAIGLPVSVFHRIEQSAGEIGGVCDAGNSCAERWVNHFGFVTIPTMAAVGFVGILVFVLLSRSAST
ncbi:MAG: disulfide bond formation protein B [Acidimicrobiia bacterium]|nr:disulfide bond formation protein B [Acidimicrobiia bacterium]